MSKHINVTQAQYEINVQIQIIKKIYDLICKQESTGIEYDNTTNLIGYIQLNSLTYKEWIDKINETFPNLRIENKGLYIYFADKNLEQELLNKYVKVYTSYADNPEIIGIPSNISVTTTGAENTWGFRRIFAHRIDNTYPINNYDIITFNELGSLSNVKSIASQEFRDITTLTSIDLTNITKIGSNAFIGCINLDHFNGVNSVTGTLSLPNLVSDGLKNEVFLWEKNSNNIRVGPQITRITNLGNLTKTGNSSFAYSTTLTTIDDGVLDNITEFGSYTFYECVNLEIDDLKLPNISNIHGYAFADTKIKSISELGVCDIESGAFRDCSLLTTISNEALANIKTLGEEAFYNTSLIIENLSMPNLTSIGNYAFQNTKIKAVSNLGSITTITGFTECTQLTNVVIPSSCTTVGKYAFKNCVNLNIQNTFFTQIKFFWEDCFYGSNKLPTNIYLPQVTVIQYRAFKNTNVRSLYLPKLKHTNGIEETQVPHPHWNQHRGGEWFMKCGNNMDILYLKNISKINSGIFGGRDFNDKLGFTIPADLLWNWKNHNNHPYAHVVNNTPIGEYDGDLPVPFGDINTPKLDYEYNVQANIKYLVINNINPPKYWGSWTPYNNVTYGPVGLWGNYDGGSEETFTYLVVPRASINTYKNWIALQPDLSNVTDPELLEYMKQHCYFDKTKIIAIESMGHFATAEAYDASPIEDKSGYLIEEYLEDNTIQWDAAPSWTAYGVNNEYM